VERYLLFRAAQLTVSHGCDWFETIDRHTDKDTDDYSDPDPFLLGWGGPYWGFYQPGFGWRLRLLVQRRIRRRVFRS
jgi:hypothetical protein